MVENRGPGPRAERCRARGAGSRRTPACRSRAERPHAPAHTRPRLSVHSLPRSRPRCRRPPGSRRAARRLDPCVRCGVVAASAGDPAVVMRRNPQLTGLCGSSARHGGCDRRHRAVSALGAQRPDRSQFRRLTFQSRTPRMCGELVGGRAEAEGPVGSCPSGPGQQWGPQGGRWLQGSETPRARTSRAISFPPPSRAASRLPRGSCRRHPSTPAPRHEYSEPMQRARKGLFLTVWRGAGSPSLGRQEPRARLQPLSSPGLRCWPWNGPPRSASHPWGRPGRIPKMLAREVTGQPPFPVINTKPLRAAEEQTEASGGRLALAE